MCLSHKRAVITAFALFMSMLFPLFAESVLASLPMAEFEEQDKEPAIRVVDSNRVELDCEVQRLKAVIAPDGVRFVKLENNGNVAEGLSLIPVGLGRNNEFSSISNGVIKTEKQKVILERGLLNEEFSSSMDGIRQDFIVHQKPQGKGSLQLNLQLKGGTIVGEHADGLRIRVVGRDLTYHRLIVTDAEGNQFKADMQRLSDTSFALVVDDSNAVYPLRIDPTISNSAWMSLGNGTKPVFPGWVRAIAKFSVDNKIYVGGDFINVPGVTNGNYLICWDGTSWSAVGNDGSGGPAITGSIFSICEYNNKLYVGGSFTNACGSANGDYAVVWDGSSWSTLEDGSGNPAINNKVEKIKLNTEDSGAGNPLVFCGYFTDAGGVAEADYIAHYNGTSFSALGSDGAGNGAINSFVSDFSFMGTKTYIVGNFSGVGAEMARYIAVYDSSSSTWSKVGTYSFMDRISYIEVYNNEVYILDPYNVNNVDGNADLDKCVKFNGTNWVAVKAGETFSSGSYDLTVANGKLYIGAKISGTTKNYCVWDGTNLTAGEAGISSGSIFAFYEDATSGHLYIGGGFTNIDGVPYNDYLIKTTGSTVVPMGSGGPSPAFSSYVYDMAMYNNELYVGGSFTDLADNTKADYIAKWNGSSWEVLGDNGSGGSALNSAVYSLEVFNNKLYIGGSFQSGAGNAMIDYLGVWDGSSWSHVGDNGSGGASINQGAVYDLHVFNSKLYACGGFAKAGSDALAVKIAVWDGSSWAALGDVASGASITNVYAIEDDGTNLYVGGQFTNLSGDARMDHIAKWDGSAWTNLGEITGDGALNERVHALEFADGILYAGGRFTDAQTIANADYIAKWDGTSWSAVGDDGSGGPALGGMVKCLLKEGTSLFVGGAFSDAFGNADADKLVAFNGSQWSPVFSSGGVVGDWNVERIKVIGQMLYLGVALQIGGNDLNYGLTYTTLGNPPVIAQGESLAKTMDEDTTLSLTGTDISATDPDGDAITWSISGNGSNGNVTTLTQSGNSLTSVVYTPNANYYGTDSFTVQAGDAGGSSDTITVNVTINNINDAPVLSVANDYQQHENTGAHDLNLNLVISDDSTNLTGATVTISTNYASGQDVLAFANTGGISGSWDSNTGVLTLSGTDTVANYQAAMRTITFNNTSENPDTTTRVVTWVVTDDSSAVSNGLTQNVGCVPSNDAPTLNAAYTIEAIEGISSLIYSTASVADIDDIVLTSVLVTMQMGYQSTEDTLSATASVNITTDFDTAGGKLHLFGTATIAEYQEALRSIAYLNTSKNANTGMRFATVTIYDEDGANATQGMQINVSRKNDPPEFNAGSNLNITIDEAQGSVTYGNVGCQATDPEGDIIYYAFDTLPTKGTASMTSNTWGKFNYSPTPFAYGTDSFIIQSSDGSALSTLVVTYTINPINSAPTITEGTSTSVTMSEDASPTAFSLTLNATDNDPTDTITWSTNTAPSNGTASVTGSGTSASVSYIPNANFNGSDSFTVVAEDGVTSDSITVNVTVESINDNPSILDLSSDTLTYTVGDGAVKIDQSTAASISDIDSTTFSSVEVKIISGADTNEDVLGIVSAGSGTGQISVSGSDVSYEGNVIGAYSWTASTSTLNVTLNSTANAAAVGALLNSVSYNNIDQQITAGNRSVQYTLTDGEGGTATVTATVGFSNVAPVISSASFSIAESSSVGTVLGTLSATDDQNATLTWSITGGTGQSVFSLDSSSGQLSLAAALDYESLSSYSLIVSANDGSLSGTKNLTIIVTDSNEAPSFSAFDASDRTLKIGELFSLDLDATDPDAGASLSFLSAGLPSWLKFDSLTGVLSGTPKTENGGQRFALVLRVSDGELEDSEKINLMVETPPVTVTLNSLTVKVLNPNGSIVAGASVQVKGNPLISYTNSLGEVTFQVPSNLKKVTLKVRADSYLAHEETVTLADLTNMTKTFTLSDQVVSINGIVSASGGSKLATVAAYHPNHGSFDVSCSASGFFTLQIPNPSTAEEWTIGASKEGFQPQTQTLTISPNGSSFLAFTLVSGANFSYSIFDVEGSKVKKVVQVISKPAFQSGDETSAILNFKTMDGAQNTGAFGSVSFNSDESSLEFEYTRGANETLALLEIQAAPSGGTSGSVEVKVSFEEKDEDYSRAMLTHFVDRILGSSQSLASKNIKVDGSDKLDRTAFELPTFGVSDTVDAIRMERKEVKLNQSGFKQSGAMYSFDALDINGSAETVLDNSHINEVYLTFPFDPDEWDPTQGGVVLFSEDGGNTWQEHDISNLLYLDTVNNTVTMKTDHLSVWTLATSAGGLFGNSGSGSNSGGGCLLKE